MSESNYRIARCCESCFHSEIDWNTALHDSRCNNQKSSQYRKIITPYHVCNQYGGSSNDEKMEDEN